MDLIKSLAPVMAGLITALVAIWTWYRQRAVERGKQTAEQTTRYVTPFLFAAEDLQSRLYNIAELNPVAVLDDTTDRRQFATETIYLVAQYFYYEALLLQYTPFGRDPDAVAAIQRVRRRFSEAGGSNTRDAWCIFHHVNAPGAVQPLIRQQRYRSRRRFHSSDSDAPSTPARWTRSLPSGSCRASIRRKVWTNVHGGGWHGSRSNLRCCWSTLRASWCTGRPGTGHSSDSGTPHSRCSKGGAVGLLTLNVTARCLHRPQ